MAQRFARMKRDSLIALTAAARQRLPDGLAILLHGNKEMTRSLSDADVETLLTLLERVLTNAEGAG